MPLGAIKTQSLLVKTLELHFYEASHKPSRTATFLRVAISPSANYRVVSFDTFLSKVVRASGLLIGKSFVVNRRNLE